jgi:hypothetical protein
MIRVRSFAELAVVAGLPLAACSVAEDNPANQTTATTEAAATAGVGREAVEREEAPVTPIAPAVAIQSQPGPDGSQVDLIKLAVTGDILTATFRCSSQDKINTEAFRVEGISIIDDATSQRISVLKDNAGNWLASSVSGTSIMADCEVKPGIFWAKFPAPPATSKTVSVNLPDTAPFDGVPVTR